MCVYIHMCVCVKRKSPTHTHMYKQLLVPCAAAHNPPAQKLKANFNYVLSTTTPRSLRFFFFVFRFLFMPLIGIITKLLLLLLLSVHNIWCC